MGQAVRDAASDAKSIVLVEEGWEPGPADRAHGGGRGRGSTARATAAADASGGFEMPARGDGAADEISSHAAEPELRLRIRPMLEGILAERGRRGLGPMGQGDAESEARNGEGPG